MNRRQAVLRLGSLVLLVPASRLITACASSTTSGGTPSPTPTSPDLVAFTSSVVSSHSHVVQIEVASFQNPPPGGIQKDTSSVVDPVNGVDHFHTVALTDAELNSIESG